MPWDQVLSKFKRGTLHSGSKRGPEVHSRAQAIAIMLSERRAAQEGHAEYQGTDEEKRRKMKKHLNIESNKGR